MAGTLLDSAVAVAGLREPATRFRLFGCPVDPLTMEDAVAWCLEACHSAGRARILLTANASHLVAMRGNPALQEAGLAADLVTADGMSLVWAARLLGHQVPERVAGIDLLQRLLEEGDRLRLRVFLLGARQEVLDRVQDLCRTRYPNLTVAGSRNGYFAPAEHEEVVRQIHDSRADILFVAMPSPFKDLWCQHHRDGFGVRLVIGVGGSFDVLAGVVRRAPRWMQRVGLEWSWRLINEPRKLWKRYLIGNSVFAWMLLTEIVRRRRIT